MTPSQPANTDGDRTDDDRSILDFLETDARLCAALMNVGIDMRCGTCAAIFFTGFALPGDLRTCGRPNDSVVVTFTTEATDVPR